MEPFKADLSLAMIERIQKSGHALCILEEVLFNDIFHNLSKHNPFWASSDEMDDLRMKLGSIQDKLLEAVEMLTIDPFQGNL